MNFNKLINSILKEEMSREDRIKALKSFGDDKQYVVFKIFGSYSHTPETIVDSFGQKRTTKNLGVKKLKFEDYFNTHSLYEYIETVYIPVDLSRDYYSKPDDVLKEWLKKIPSEEEDRLYGVRNSSKDMVIAGIDYEDKDMKSEIYVAFPLEQRDLLITLLRGIRKSYKEFIDRINEEEAVNVSILTNSYLHLAEYFLNLPGNQRLK